MLLVAGIGLVINGFSTFLLVKTGRQDLNIRSALLHEIGDMVSSLAVVAAAITIVYTKNYLVDPYYLIYLYINCDLGS